MNTRRQMLLGTLATAGALGGLTQPARAATPKVVWKMGTSFPATLDTI
jgi:TRAP-type mannitol/chloroaromatic compound transport system substrate-binding protein